MANSYIQVRVDDSDKEKAGEILEGLGTNLSMVINMLLKQIIMTKGIPFEIKMNKSYSREELLSELKVAMAMDDLEAIKKAMLKEE